MAVTKETIEEALQVVKDPELNFSLVELGLIYRIDINEAEVEVDMTLTAPGCPVADQIVQSAQTAVEGVDGVRKAKVNLVWEPRWTPEMMKEEVRWLFGR